VGLSRDFCYARLGCQCRPRRSWPSMVIGRSSTDLGRTKHGDGSLVNPNAHFLILLFLALFASLMHGSIVQPSDGRSSDGKRTAPLQGPLTGARAHQWVDTPSSSGSSAGPYPRAPSRSRSGGMFWPSTTRWLELDGISRMARRHTVATMARLERAARAGPQDPSTRRVDPPQSVVVATGFSHRGESRNLLIHLFD
jgi:hypothetical protein